MAITPPLPCKRVANLECEWPNCKCYPLSPPGETPRAEHWKSMLAKVGGWDNELAAVPAGGVRKLIEEFGNLERELRQAQERCANVAKSLGYAITLLEVEHDWDKCLQYLIAVRDKNDAAASGPKEGH